MSPFYRRFNFSLRQYLTGFLLLLPVFSPLSSLEFKTGPALWIYGDTHLPALEFELGDEYTSGDSGFSWNLFLPLYFPFNNSPYLQGLPITNDRYEWINQTNTPIDLLTYIKKLHFSLDFFQIGITPRISETGLTHALWGNPLFRGSTGFHARYLAIQFFDEMRFVMNLHELCQNCKLPMLLFHYNIAPFANDGAYFLKRMLFTPILWVRGESSQYDYGGGFELKTGGFESDTFRSGLILSTQVFSSLLIAQEELSHRSSAGLFGAFSDIGFQLAYLYKSSYHPNGTFLSPLSPARHETPFYGNGQQNHGILFGVTPGFAGPNGLLLDVEYYPEITSALTLRAKLRFSDGTNHFDFTWTKENVTQLDTLFELQNPQNYLGIEGIYFIVPEILKLHITAMINHNQGQSDLKSTISVLANFSSAPENRTLSEK